MGHLSFNILCDRINQPYSVVFARCCRQGPRILVSVDCSWDPVEVSSWYERSEICSKKKKKASLRVVELMVS